VVTDDVVGADRFPKSHRRTLIGATTGTKGDTSWLTFHYDTITRISASTTHHLVLWLLSCTSNRYTPCVNCREIWYARGRCPALESHGRSWCLTLVIIVIRLCGDGRGGGTKLAQGRAPNHDGNDSCMHRSADLSFSSSQAYRPWQAYRHDEEYVSSVQPNEIRQVIYQQAEHCPPS
jgi:hypothetical protein